MDTTITADDIIRALDDHPQWLEPLCAHFRARGDTEMPYILERLAAGREYRLAARRRQEASNEQ